MSEKSQKTLKAYYNRFDRRIISEYIIIEYTIICRLYLRVHLIILPTYNILFVMIFYN